MRQAPQEIIEPNELPEEDDGDQEKDKQSEDEEQGAESEESVDKDALKISTTGNKPKGGITRCEFNEVKLCSKYGAFLITKPSGTFIYYSTQNSRVKGEIAKQKL